MSMPQQSFIVFNDAKTINDMWCVYRIDWIRSDGLPPKIMYINACKLTDVYRLREARTNSEFARLFLSETPIGQLMVHIIATSLDRVEMQNHAVRLVKAGEMPQCNLHGWNMDRAARRLQCSNGQTYENQTEAAKALGITQSAISQHLAGHLSAVRGMTFSYVAPNA